MRALFAVLAALFLADCASGAGGGRSEAVAPNEVLVIIGVAETRSDRDPAYSMLWRRLDDNGQFTDYDDVRAIEARTNSRGSLRVRGIPGEFIIARVAPGAYALDSVFAVLIENRLEYYAQGPVEGPERPSFEVAPGEAVYLGIWEVGLDGAFAVARPWRLDAADLRAVLRAADLNVGEVRMRATRTRAVPCNPHRINAMTQRQIC